MKSLSKFTLLVLAVLSAACSKSKIQDLVPDKNNGGITLPEKFGAVVVVDSIGVGRHMAIGSNGDIYLHLSKLALDGKGIIALRDTSGDGHADIIKGYSNVTGTGIELHNGYLYVDEGERIARYRHTAGQLLPATAAEVIVQGMPLNPGHRSRNFAFGSDGSMFVNVGSATNSCQVRDRQLESPGIDPCTELATRAGIWKFEAEIGRAHV